MTLRPWQVWWYDPDPTVGHEQAKRRPGVIVSSATHLRLANGQMLTILPMTTQERPDWGWRVAVTLPGKAPAWVITEQVRTISSRRLAGRTPIGVLSPAEIAEVRRALRDMLDM